MAYTMHGEVMAKPDSGVSRRGFFGRLFGGFVAAASFGRLQWDGTAAVARSALVTPTWVTREVARSFADSLRFSDSLDKRYDSEWADRKIGETVSVRVPRAFL